jgi:hypothetical protein
LSLLIPAATLDIAVDPALTIFLPSPQFAYAAQPSPVDCKPF